MIHLKRYFAALTVMLTLMAAYALGIAPWLEPESAVRRRGESATSSVTQRIGPTSIDLAALFTAGSWELDNPKIVETESCILLVKDYRPTADGKLELNPCTLIFLVQPEGESGPRRPIIMQAPQGAVLQFDRPLDIAQAQFGRLEGGLLPGPITIRSPESTPGQGDDLHLTTRNIQIDRERVFTPHEVEFRYGESHGRGSDLTIHLLPKDPEDPRSGVGGLKSLVLARLDRLHLVVPGKVGLPGLPAEAGADDRRTTDFAANDSTTTQLEVLCQGPVSFDMARETLVLDDGVEIERLLPGAPPDRLSCRQLQLVFREEETANLLKDSAAQAAAASEPMPQSASSSTETSDPLAGRLKKLIAIGNPARLEAPSSATVVTAAAMTLEVAKQRIYLDPSDEIPTASLRQGASHFTAHKLEYELAPAGRLGKLLAIGPGELSFIQATGRDLQTISARWRDELSIRPQDDDHRLSLTGDASVGVDPLGTFAAEQLHFWLREVEVPYDPTSEPGSRGINRAVDAAAADATAEGASPRARKYTLLPARLLATNEPVSASPARPIFAPAEAPQRLVTLTSPRLSVETRRLEVWFQIQPAVVKLPAVAERLPPTSLPREKPLKEPSLARFALVGDLIQMQVIRRGDKAELEDLVIRGGVSIDEVETDEPGQVPVRLRGDSLELRGGVTGSGTIDVVGQPAEVGGRGMWLAAGTVHVVRKENRLWIDGPGEAKFPASTALAGGALGPLAGRNQPVSPPTGEPPLKANPPEDVHVVWRDRLHFDGQTAMLDGDVQARTATRLASGKSLQLATGSSLEVSLSERIDLAESTSPSDAKLARLKFAGGVLIENRTLDEHGEQVSFDTLAVQDLVVEAAAGTLTAAGPGSLVSRRLASASLPGVSSPLPMPMPTAPVDPNAPPKLNFIHIEFQGGIVGNIAQRQIEFQNQVRTIFAPIEAWEQSVGASRLEDLGEKGVLLTSDRLKVLEMAPAGQTPWIEAYASGGAVVEGKQFTVQAPRIAFTSDKEKLTIEGDGFKDAELWHRGAPGEPSSYAAARKWSYWLRSGSLEVEGSKAFNIQQLPAGLLRLPGGRR